MFTTSKNLTLVFDQDNLNLSEELLVLLRRANSLGQPFENQGDTYGAIATALVVSLVDNLKTMVWEDNYYDTDFQKLATRLYDEAIDNGENLEYQIDLWNQDRITLPDYPNDDW